MNIIKEEKFENGDIVVELDNNVRCFVYVNGEYDFECIEGEEDIDDEKLDESVNFCNERYGWVDEE